MTTAVANGFSHIAAGVRKNGTYVIGVPMQLAAETDQPWQCPICIRHGIEVSMEIRVEIKSGYRWRWCSECLFCLPAIWRLTADATQKLIAERTAWCAEYAQVMTAMIEFGWY